MNLVKWLLCKLVCFVITVIFSAICFWCLWDYVIGPAWLTPHLPEITDKYWGEGDPKPDDETIQQFKIRVDEHVLVDLKARLNRTRNIEPLEKSNFNYGFNGRYMREVVAYWSQKYEWRQTEDKMNQYEHYKTSIEGLSIHFMRARPKAVPRGTKVLPLMIIHGWPSTFYEFIHIVPLLITPNGDSKVVFDVILPSIPGYGFSEASWKRGLNAMEIGKIFNKLMIRLGVKQYYLQGGDFGHAISNNMATLFPQNVLGWHSNFPNAGPTLSIFRYLAINIFPWAFIDMKDFHKFSLFCSNIMFEESGYFHLQTTKPDTIGFGLNDSPAGLAAYILEKYSTGTNLSHRELSDGGLTLKFSLDDLLANVMIYWVTGSITSSMRLYKEYMNHYWTYHLDDYPLTVPTAFAEFPNEILLFPILTLSRRYKNLVQYTVMPEGGHFAALEQPELLARDIHSFVNKVEFGHQADLQHSNEL